MSKSNQTMTEAIIERLPFETIPEIKYDTADLQEMTEETRKKEGLPPGAIMVFEAKIFHAGRVTANGRLYRSPLMRAESARLNEDIKERRVKGLAGHPDPDKSPDPSRACLVPLGLWMEDDGAGHAKAAIPDTSKGRDLAALVRMGVKVGFSIRGRGRATKVEMTDKHPCFQGNESWAGKTIEDVSDHYKFETFDWVDNQAVRDAELSNYHESESEDPVEFKIEDLTEDQKKAVLEADFVKAAINEATKTITADEIRKLAEGDELAGLLIKNKSLVEGLAKSKAFTDALADEFAEDDEPEPEETKVECTTCKKQIVEGATFCPDCGARQVLTEGQEPDQPADEKDKAIADLQESVKELQTENKQMKEARKAAEDKEACDKAIAEAVQDKAASVQSGVRKYLDGRTVTPDNVEGEVKDAIEFVEGLVSNEPADDTGKGKTQPTDEQIDEEDKTRDVGGNADETQDLLESNEQDILDNMDAIDL